MRSFEHGYFLETPLSHQLLKAVRALGEFSGRQALYSEQSPELLNTLRRCLGKGRDAEWERIGSTDR